MTIKHLTKFFLSFIFISLLSCTDEDDILGHNLIDPNMHEVTKLIFPNQNYTIPIYATREDSISARGNYNLLGRLNDPYFGESEASFFMQILLPSNNIELNPAENTEFTLELSLPYYDSYGDTLTNMWVNVYELNESIGSTDTTAEVYATQSFDYITSPLASPLFSITELTDSIDWSGEIVSPRLIIDLSQSGLGEKILFNSTSSDLSSNESFVDFLKGLYLDIDGTENGSIVYFNTVSTECFLRLSYTDNNNEPQIIEFPVGTSANRLNHFDHNYDNTIVLDYLNSKNPVDSLVFLQSMGGICTDIDLDFLKQFEDSSYVISKALLNLPIYEDELIDMFPPPGYLILTDYSNDEDVAIEGIIGGTYNETTKNYTFTITNHVQKIISENHNPIMRLYVGGKNSNAERLLIDNREGTQLSLELVIIK